MPTALSTVNPLASTYQVLRWGRRLMATEIWTHIRWLWAKVSLQWGRRLMATEIQDEVSSGRIIPGFNGAVV